MNIVSFIKKPILVCTLVLGGFYANAQARLIEKVTATGDAVVIPYEKYQLPNGLVVIVHEDHSDPIVHIDVTYHVGSAREQSGKSGFAHFFEHMMFMGSEHAPEKLHDKITIGNGGTNNGSTNNDRTNYYETVPSNVLEPALWLEADRMGFLLDAVTQPKFEVQRATVKNERGQNYDNSPYGLVFENISKNLYPYGHPYSWTTIGSLEDLDRSNVNDLKNFFLRWYGPNNATLTIGGDVKPAEVMKMVEKYFGSIPPVPEVPKMKVDPVHLTADRYVSYTDNYARLPMLNIVYPAVPDYDKDLPALECLAQILGSGKTSLFYQMLIKSQKALQATAFVNSGELAGEFFIRLLPVTGGSLHDMETMYRSVLDSFEKRGVTDDDLVKFKGQIEAGLISGLQTVHGKVAQLAAYQTFTGNPNLIGKELKEYTAVTKADVLRVYNTYIKNKGAVILSVVPRGQEKLLAHADNYKIDSTGFTPPDYGYDKVHYTHIKDQFDRNKIPTVASIPVVKMPAFWKKNLPGGTQLIGIENREIPMVSFSLRIPGGQMASANDLSKAGLAGMFVKMMNEDTRNFTAEQMAAELQKLGSNIFIQNQPDGISFTVQSLKKNFTKTIALLQERLMHPRFTEESFARLKKQTLETFKLQKSQPAAIANNIALKLTYGPQSVLGYSPDGTEASVSNLTLADVQKYYDTYITAVGSKASIAGDINAPEAEKALSFLNTLPKREVKLSPLPATPAIAQTKVYMVDVPKSAQSEFRIGYGMDLPYDVDGKFYKLTLANYIIGGDFTSRLNQYLRETKGWTYGATSRFGGNKYGGRFNFSSGIRTNATDSALASVMHEFTDYSQNGPSDEEIATMKKAIGQGEALNYEALGQKLQFLNEINLYNAPGNYTEKQAQIRKDLTAKEIRALTAVYFNPTKMNILLIGDKSKILDGVKKLGYEVVFLDADGNPVDKKTF